jgi:acetyltransferase-like isoleucine patch superfamily enzyme
LIEIRSGVWIGHGVRIVGKNISIGENSIIGAGAVVIGNVEPNSIVAGVPAKKIGVRTPSERVWHFGDVYFSPHTFEKLDNNN